MRHQIRLLKSVDGFIAPLIRFLPPAPFRPAAVRNLKRILIIRPGGIGDAVLLLPTLRALEKAFPRLRVDVLAEKRNAEVFSLYPPLNRIYCYENLRDVLDVICQNYDAVIDTEQWHHLSALVARLTRAPLSIGFATNNRARLFTHPVAYSHDDFETDSFTRLLEALSGEKPDEATTPYYSIPTAVAKKAAELLGGLADGLFIALFPGASIREKRWPIERFAELADYFAQKGIPVVVLGGKSEVIAGNNILAGKSGKNLAGTTSLVETAALIGKAAVLVSGDSGLLHIAAGLGRPTVSLFGPSNTKKWAPKGEQHMVISRNLSCSPCSKFGYTPKCPINARCVGEITVKEVIAAVEKLLGKRSK